MKENMHCNAYILFLVYCMFYKLLLPVDFHTTIYMSTQQMIKTIYKTKSDC